MDDQILDQGLLDTQKAADPYSTTNTSTLVPTIYSEGIRRFFEDRSPLWNILRKIDWNGMSYSYRAQTSLPTPSFRSELETLPDATRANWGPSDFPLKSIYIRGEVSGQLQVASQTVVGSMIELAVRNASEGLIRGLELKLITGDSAVDPDEFDGIAKQITNTMYIDSNNNGTGTAGDLTFAHMDQLLRTPAGGGTTHLIMSQRMASTVSSLLQPQMRYDTAEVDGGFKVRSWNGVPIIEVFDPHGGYFGNTILAIDNNYIVVPISKQPTYEEMAHVLDSLDFIIKRYLAVVVEGPSRYHAKLVGASDVIV